MSQKRLLSSSYLGQNSKTLRKADLLQLKQIDDLKYQVQTLEKKVELLNKENSMLRLNSPMSFGELSKAVSENHDKEILQDMAQIIFEFY